MWTLESPYDVPGLEGLRGVAQRNKVSFSLIGSVCRRILWAREIKEYTPLSIMDLSPFLSDIDLVYSGPSSKDSSIREDIVNRVPFAEAFQWQLISNERKQDFDAAREFGPLIPDNMLRLDERGFRDEFGAAEDLRSNRFRFLRSKNYLRSPLREKKADLEIFGAIMYFRNLLQVAQPANLSLEILAGQPGLETVAAICSDVPHDGTIELLSQSEYLRTRLFYLSAAFATAGSPGQVALMLDVGLGSVLNLFARRVPELATQLKGLSEAGCRPLIISAHLRRDDKDTRTDVFRTNMLEKIALSIGAQAQEVLEQSLSAPPPEDRALLVSSPLTFENGEGWYSEVAPGQFHEFLFLSIPIEQEIAECFDGVTESDLAVCAALHAEGPELRQLEDLVFSLPALCTIQRRSTSESTLQIRVNCYGALIVAYKIYETLELSTTPSLRLAILTPKART
jgi:hypothetical protein